MENIKKKKIKVTNNIVRPTSNNKREAIFSILESFSIKNSFELYKDRCFIDLFAGTGSLGLEAISRGASISYFFEIDQVVCNTLNNNCKSICKDDEFYIYKKDLTQINDINIDLPCSAIFVDPPYKFDFFDIVFQSILKSNILDTNTIIVIETDILKNLNIVSKLEIIKQKKYGITKILFLKKLS